MNHSENSRYYDDLNESEKDKFLVRAQRNAELLRDRHSDEWHLETTLIRSSYSLSLRLFGAAFILIAYYYLKATLKSPSNPEDTAVTITFIAVALLASEFLGVLAERFSTTGHRSIDYAWEFSKDKRVLSEGPERKELTLDKY